MEIITVREAAEILGCTRENVYHLIKKKKLVAAKPGRDWQVDRLSVEILRTIREKDETPRR